MQLVPLPSTKVLGVDISIIFLLTWKKKKKKKNTVSGVPDICLHNICLGKKQKAYYAEKAKKMLLIHPQYHVPQLLSAQIPFPPHQNIYRRAPDAWGDQVMLFLADHT